MNAAPGESADSPRLVTQRLIAEHVGISSATVSRCFTNHAGINPVTRAKVFDVASKLGYHHTEMRRPSKRRRAAQKRIGVLVCTEIEEYFRPDYESPGVKLYAGVVEFSHLHNLKIELHYVDPKEKSLDSPSYQAIAALREGGWSGVILIYPFHREIIDEIDRRFPMVSLVEQYGTAAFNCVDVDHGKGVSTMINKLDALGHEYIGFYTLRYEIEAQWSLRRFSAYVEEMARQGRPLLLENTVNVHPKCSVSLKESFDYVRERIGAGVTAWVCAADHQAYDLIAALGQRGVRVPEDVSITGFDGIAKPDWAPLLTTAIVPYWEIGYTGTRRLLDVMRKREGLAPLHCLVASRFREGETVAPAPVKAGGSQRAAIEAADRVAVSVLAPA